MNYLSINRNLRIFFIKITFMIILDIYKNHKMIIFINRYDLYDKFICGLIQMYSRFIYR